MNESHTQGLFDQIGFYILLITCALLPIFFVPFSGIGAENTKLYLLVFGTALALIAWVIARLVDGTVHLPHNSVLMIAGGLSLWFVIAGLFSPSPYLSFVGQSFDVGTSVSIITMTILMFLAASYFNTKERVSQVYLYLFFGFVVTVLFQIIFSIVGPDHLSLGTFTSTVSNLIGKWNDLGIYVGFMAMMSILSFELFSPQKVLRTIMGVTLGASLVGMILVNFVPVWIALGAFSLVIFIYTLSIKRNTEHATKVRFPVISFVMVIICLLFILGNGFIGGFFASKLGFSQTEVRPSVSSTLSVLKETLIHNPIIGSGPNRFNASWNLYHPEVINTTAFWDVPFTQGFGLLPTFFVTVGLLGGLLFLSLIGMCLKQGMDRIFSTSGDKASHYLFLSSFIGALYLWLFVIIYNPGIVLFALAFVLTGIFIGLRISMGYGKIMIFNFLKDPRQSFFSILLLVVLLIGALTGLYAVGKKAVALGYYSKAYKITQAEDIKIAEVALTRATLLDPSPLYYRALAQVYTSEISQLLSETKLSEDTVKSEFQNLFGGARGAAEAALLKDKNGVENLIMLGSIYQAIVPLGVTGAYDNAKVAYLEAQKHAPMNPGIDLLLARLEVDHKDNKTARVYIESALKKKPNYTDAIFLLSQIEVSEGNVANAIIQVEQASLIEPNNSVIFFQLGLLRYNNKDYGGAASAFERAIGITPDYLNARYFLGLVYEKLGRTADEIAQFTYIHDKVPDNQSIQTILDNLALGQPALTDTSTPAPEKDKTLPVSDKEVGQ